MSGSGTSEAPWLLVPGPGSLGSRANESPDFQGTSSGGGSSEPAARAAATWCRKPSTSTPRWAGANGPSRRSAFSSCRSNPVRFPRPAWYHATTTCTSPWKKSFSSGSDARHASSSASCAAKYSPRRARSSPRSRSVETDLDLSVLDLDLVGLRLNREVEVVLAGLRVVLPAVPRAGEVVVRVEHALAERPFQVQAVPL